MPSLRRFEENNMVSLRSLFKPSIVMIAFMIFSVSTTVQAHIDHGLVSSSIRVGARAALARYPWLGYTRSPLSRITRESPCSISQDHHPTQTTSLSPTWAIIPSGGGFQKKQKYKDDKNVLVQLIQDSFNPGSLSYGFVTGYVSGVALKTVGKATATILGVGFISLQVLAYNGIIEVNHSVIEEKLEAMLDRNRDGRVCRDDGAVLTEQVMNILQHNLPSAGGFVAGFMGGINFG